MFAGLCAFHMKSPSHLCEPAAAARRNMQCKYAALNEDNRRTRLFFFYRERERKRKRQTQSWQYPVPAEGKKANKRQSRHPSLKMNEIIENITSSLSLSAATAAAGGN